MTDVLHRRSLRQVAAPEAIEAVHEELETLWDEASFVPDMDRMTFATAVIEAASNVVQHAVPASAEPVELGVEICVEQMQPGSPRQRPRRGPARSPGRRTSMPDDDAESGRGLALIRALVTTVTFSRQEGTNIWTLSKSPFCS